MREKFNNYIGNGQVKKSRSVGTSVAMLYGLTWVLRRGLSECANALHEGVRTKRQRESTGLQAALVFSGRLESLHLHPATCS